MPAASATPRCRCARPRARAVRAAPAPSCTTAPGPAAVSRAGCRSGRRQCPIMSASTCTTTRVSGRSSPATARSSVQNWAKAPRSSEHEVSMSTARVAEPFVVHRRQVGTAVDEVPIGDAPVVVVARGAHKVLVEQRAPVEAASMGVAQRLLDAPGPMALSLGEAHRLVHGLIPRLLLGGDVNGSCTPPVRVGGEQDATGDGPWGGDVSLPVALLCRPAADLPAPGDEATWRTSHERTVAGR